MNVLPLVVVLVAATSPVGRVPDPPHVLAAKERLAKAKAFEVVLAVTKVWKNVTPVQSDERNDFFATGTVKLVVDGKRYWYLTDVPTLNGMRSGVVRRHNEWAFDGQIARMRHDFEQLKGERAGQVAPMSQVIHSGGSAGWWQTSEPIQPLAWLLHGFNRTLEKAEADEITDTLDGVRCERHRTDPHFPDRDMTVWFDPQAGYVPRRVESSNGKQVTQLSYHHSGSPGWVPSGWVTSDRSNPAKMGAETTTVTVESFQVRESIPDERFTVNFQAGSQVVRMDGNRTVIYTVAAGGSLVPVESDPPASASDSSPQPPSLWLTLGIVGTTLAVFVALAVLLRRLTREDKPPPDAIH